MPYFDGERTPNRPDASGWLTGLRADSTREDVARAAYEGVVSGLLDGLDALGTAGVRTDGRMFLIGGGARSAAFRRVVADLAQRAVTVVDDDELVARGACIQAAARAAGAEIVDVQHAWGIGAGAEVEPDASVDASIETRARYAALRDRDRLTCAYRRLVTDPDAGKWNHNIHYQPVLLDAIAGSRRVLDVGSGDGVLTPRSPAPARPSSASIVTPGR